jgi:hypothetical protein
MTQEKVNVTSSRYLSIGTRIPEEYLTRRAAILAKVDSGKTYMAGKIEEQLAKKGLPFVVMDPMGAHWGIRTKYPILIFGGKHGDIEIEPGDGRYIAQVVVQHNLTCIVDINEFSKEEQQQFAADFGDELFLLHKISSSPRHVFWEEADIFAPQKTKAVSLPVLDTLVRRGRQFGIGTTMITQRPAVLNKDVLTQVDVYFFMNMIAEQDTKVIDDLLKIYNKQQRRDLLDEVINFNKGQALLYSPSWLKITKTFQGSKKESYHAGQTPVYGETLKIPPLLNYETSHIKTALNIITGAKTERDHYRDSESIKGKLTLIVGISVGALLIAVVL